jgi:hypothetical protein
VCVWSKTECSKEVCLFIYLAVKLASSTEWRPKNYKNERQTLRAINNRLIRVPNITAKVPENIYVMICESKILHGIEIWGVKGDGKLLEKSRDDVIRKS